MQQSLERWIEMKKDIKPKYDMQTVYQEAYSINESDIPHGLEQIGDMTKECGQRKVIFTFYVDDEKNFWYRSLITA